MISEPVEDAMKYEAERESDVSIYSMSEMAAMYNENFTKSGKPRKRKLKRLAQ